MSTIEQVVYSLTKGVVQDQSLLMIDGSVSAAQNDAYKQFEEKKKDIIGDVAAGDIVNEVEVSMVG